MIGEFLQHVKYAGVVAVGRLIDALKQQVPATTQSQMQETDAARANRQQAEKYAATINSRVWKYDRPQIYKAQASASASQQQQPQQELA
jgi:hypothetical protein